MASALALSSSCLSISSKLCNLSLKNFPSSKVSVSTTTNVGFKPLSFSSVLSHNMFFSSSTGRLSMRRVESPVRHLIVCESSSNKKGDSAVKRVRQAEVRRLRNKARKSEVKTRMKKALDALELLRKKQDAQAEEISPIEKLIGEAYSAIDKAVIKGTLHKNTGARRKSRLARRKRAVEIHHGWYTPDPAAVTA